MVKDMFSLRKDKNEHNNITVLFMGYFTVLIETFDCKLHCFIIPILHFQLRKNNLFMSTWLPLVKLKFAFAKNHKYIC